MRVAVRQIGLWFCLAVATLALIAYLSFHAWADRGRNHSAAVIEIKSGASLSSITQQLVELDVVHHPRLFKLLTSWASLDTQLKAGEYELDNPISPRQLLKKFSTGQVMLHPVRLREGITALAMLQIGRAHV